MAKLAKIVSYFRMVRPPLVSPKNYVLPISSLASTTYTRQFSTIMSPNLSHSHLIKVSNIVVIIIDRQNLKSMSPNYLVSKLLKVAVFRPRQFTPKLYSNGKYLALICIFFSYLFRSCTCKLLLWANKILYLWTINYILFSNGPLLI